MRKTLLFTTFVLFFINQNIHAQYKLDEGQGQLNAGLGLSSKWGKPVYIGFDYGVHRYISVGAEATYRIYNDNYTNTQGLNVHTKQTTTAVLVNGNFHFTGLLGFQDEWDVYMGLNAGVAYNYNIDSKSNSTVGGVGAQVGMRYYFTDNLAINLELGGATIFDWGKVGISIVL